MLQRRQTFNMSHVSLCACCGKQDDDASASSTLPTSERSEPCPTSPPGSSDRRPSDGFWQTEEGRELLGVSVHHFSREFRRNVHAKTQPPYEDPYTKVRRALRNAYILSLSLSLSLCVCVCVCVL